MYRICIIGLVLVSLLSTTSCDLLNSKETMDGFAREMSDDPEEKLPPGKD
ncbi:hypothetical protein MM239_19335 [Belliella sp. DSM 111904]|uniref:Uncharacterized protein n=1 Tax=Belliella filtrata TaxID=2923435 RepID=A0ABS9V5R3_9BACT|nr:hypothetical protein [Belliella filtrata]MCH7411549.1 hypothetical protein [Belliella filtrata]